MANVADSDMENDAHLDKQGSSGAQTNQCDEQHAQDSTDAQLVAQGARDVQMFKQGAEARLYCCVFLGRQTVVKERFTKCYRHPALDRSLTAQRTKSEARCMLRCRMHGMTLLLKYKCTI